MARWDNSPVTYNNGNTRCVACRSCKYTYTVDEMPNTYFSNFCHKYPRGSNKGKPDDVVYNGAECPFFEPE